MRALLASQGGVVAVYAGASSKKGSGATLGDQISRGGWPPTAPRKGVNWKEFQAIERALNSLWALILDKPVLVRVGNTAASYAKYAAGRSSELTVVARSIKEREIAIPCALMASQRVG